MDLVQEPSCQEHPLQHYIQSEPLARDEVRLYSLAAYRERQCQLGANTMCMRVYMYIVCACACVCVMCMCICMRRQYIDT